MTNTISNDITQHARPSYKKTGVLKSSSAYLSMTALAVFFMPVFHSDRLQEQRVFNAHL